MPSGAKRRKAAKKKKEKETEHWQGQGQALQEDSGNENENENEHANEEVAITPKTKEEEGEGESSVQQEDDSVDISSTVNHPLERTDVSLAVPENGGVKENELAVLSGGALHDKNVLIDEAHSKLTGEGDEIHPGELVTRTEAGLIGLGRQSGAGDESEVLSSKVIPNQNELNQTTRPFTDVHEHSPKDDTYVDMASPSQELESSDGDEINLDILSTLAVFDTNESSQSLGSVESPRSSQPTSSQKFPDQTSNDTAILIFQDEDGISQGISETSFHNLSNGSESDHTPVYEVQIDAIKLHQKGSSLFAEAMKGFKNEETIQIPAESVSNNNAIQEEEFCESVVNCENIQGAVLISSDPANKESEAISRVEENIAKTLAVSLHNLESSNMRGTPVISISGEASGTTVGEGSRGLISNGGESSRDMISTGGEAIGDAAYNGGKSCGDVVSNGAKVCGDMFSTGIEASGDKLGLPHVQGSSVDCKEIYNEKLLPQNGENEQATFLQRGTSWFSCCGILELYRRA